MIMHNVIHHNTSINLINIIILIDIISSLLCLGTLSAEDMEELQLPIKVLHS